MNGWLKNKGSRRGEEEKTKNKKNKRKNGEEEKGEEKGGSGVEIGQLTMKKTERATVQGGNKACGGIGMGRSEEGVVVNWRSCNERPG